MNPRRFAKSALKAALMTLVLSQVSACASTGAGAPGATMLVGAAVPAPGGFVAFCQRTPSECSVSDAPVDAAPGTFTAADSSHQPVQSAGLTWSGRSAALAAEGQAVSLGAPSASGFRTSRDGADWATLFAAARLERTEPSQSQASRAGGEPVPVSTPHVTLTRETLATLTRVNQSVNREISFGDDTQTWGNSDYWALPMEQGKGVGDCEDYVLEKRRALVAAGVPAQALSIALVITPWGESHAVLLVATDQGDMVLDNLSSWVTRWNTTGYHWMERQAPGGDSMAWVTVTSRDPG